MVLLNTAQESALAPFWKAHQPEESKALKYFCNHLENNGFGRINDMEKGT